MTFSGGPGGYDSPSEHYVGRRYATPPPPAYPPRQEPVELNVDPYQHRASTAATTGRPWTPPPRAPRRSSKSAVVTVGAIVASVAVFAVVNVVAESSSSSRDIPRYTPPPRVDLPRFTPPPAIEVPSIAGDSGRGSRDGAPQSELPDDVHELSVGQPIEVEAHSGGRLGEITLHEVRRNFECDDSEPYGMDEGHEVIGLRLSTSTNSDAIGFIDIQSHTARAMDEDWNPVDFSSARSCTSDPIQQITNNGASEEGWFTLVVDPDIALFAWDHGTGDAWVMVDVSESSTE